MLLSSSQLFDLLKLDQYSPAQAQRILARARRVASGLRRRNGDNATFTLRMLLDRVTVSDAEIQVSVSAAGTRNALGLTSGPGNDDVPPTDTARYCIQVPAQLRRCGGASRLIISGDDMASDREPDTALVKILGRAHDWFARLATGKAQSAAEIAREEGLTRSYVTRVLRLAFLAPDITEAILNGRHPPNLNAERLVRNSRLPLAWHDQRRVLGFHSR